MKKNIQCILIFYYNFFSCFYLFSDWIRLGNPMAMTGQNDNENAGYSVAINSAGTRVVFGEFGWSGYRGRVLVYNLSGDTWIAVGSPTAMTGQNTVDLAGGSVAINEVGDTVAVGELGWNGSQGRVRVYNFTGGDWVATGSATAMVGQNFGDVAAYVAINATGNTVAVGAPRWSSYSGRVRVYNFTGGDWAAIGSATAMTGQNTEDQAGWRVSLNSVGDTVAFGETGWSGGRGRVRVYNLSGTNWISVGSLTAITGQSTGDQVGVSIGLNSAGNTVVVGEYGWSGGRGRARVYNYNGTDWIVAGSPTAMTGEVANDNAGVAVAINSMGNTVAVGENQWEANNGRVRVYNYNGTDWIGVGSPSAMTGQSINDNAGFYVAMNSSGDTVAVGEYVWSGAKGRVRVFLNMTDQVNSDFDMSSFNEILFVQPTPVVQLQFPYTANYAYITTSTSGLSQSGSGNITQGTGMALVSTSTIAGSAAVLASIKKLTYRPGQGLMAAASAIFDTPNVLNTQYIGMGNATNGFFFGYNGTTFGILYRNNGVDTWIPQSSWNADVMNGSGGSGVTLNPQMGNVYKIQYHWLGFGVVKFYIENPVDGTCILVHSLSFLNGVIDGAVPMVTNGSMPLLAASVNSSTGTTNVTLKTACMMGAVQGTTSIINNSRFALAGSRTTAGGTITNIFTLLNSPVYPQGTTNSNQVMIYPDLLTFVNATAQPGIIYLIINGTGVTPATSVSSNSVVLYSTTNATITPGTTIFRYPIQAAVNTYTINLSDLGICLAPGQRLTVAVQRLTINNLTINASLSWTEGF